MLFILPEAEPTPFGTIIRYCHANIASLIFISLYAHITRNIYYSSFRAPRTSTWLIGIVILVLAIGTAFLGYSLVFGQMSLWGATVICSLFSAIPIFGNYISILLWGAFSVSSSTITRFFALHYLFALIVISAAIVHLLMLHMHSSSTPLGISGNYDRHAMSPVFLIKDSITMVMAIMVLLFLVSYIPNYLSHSDNYVVANSLVTPASIVPEWYLLTYYAILRSVPNKLVGVILMLLAIVWLAALILDVSIIRSNSYKIVTRILLVLGLYCFVVLLSLGSKHIEAPYIVLGQSTTLIYFITLLFALPSIGILENYLMSRNTESN